MDGIVLGHPGKKQSAFVTLVFLTSLLLGCTDEATRNQIDHTADQARRNLQAANEQGPAKRYNPLVVTDKVWTGDTALRMKRGMPLPPKYETAHGVTLVSTSPMSLSEIATVVSQQTGIPIRANMAGANGAGAPSSSPVNPGLLGAPGGAATPTTSANVNSTSSNGGMPVAYEGPLSGLLDRVASYFGVSWHYDGTSVSINRFETRVFSIEALPGSESVQEGMQDNSSGSSSAGGSSGGSSGGGGSSSNTITQNSKFSIDFKYWDELSQILTAMLNNVGSIVVSPSIGTVTVTTTPENMHLIADYLAQENQKLSRQIAINVEVYNVDLQEGMDFDIAFSTAIKKLTDNLSVNIPTGVIAPSVPANAANPPFGSAANLSVAIPGAHGNNATDIFSAISSIGDTTKVAKFPLITLNNRPASRRIGEDIGYLQSVSSTPIVTTATAGASTNPSSTLTPGTIHQGFTIQATPRLLDDGRILLQYSLSIIDLVTILSASSNGSSIQLPTTSNRIFVQQAVMKSGSTLILGGMEEKDLVQNSQGVGDPYNYVFGGGNTSGKTHAMVFYALTPQVLDTPHSEQD